MPNIYNPNDHNNNTAKEIQKKTNGKKPDLAKYVNRSDELNPKELKWSMWYVSHRLLLYRILIITLIIVSIALWIFSITNWLVYLLNSGSAARVDQQSTYFINYTGIHPHFSAQPIQIVSTNIFYSGNTKIDAVAELINPNASFLVKFDYYFILGGEKTKTQNGFLLPGESRPFAALGLENVPGQYAQIILENITWQRITGRITSSVPDYQAFRLNFKVSDFVYGPSVLDSGDSVSAVQFKITNDSPYGYKDASFYVALLQNNTMVGILPLHLGAIKSLESRDVDLRVFTKGLAVTGISVYPIINIYDKGVYLTP